VSRAYSTFTYKVNETFESIQGEGLLTGALVTFIRLQGCNVGCDWCDTPKGHDVDSGHIMTVERILNATREYTNRHVVITGGEPTLQDLFPLLLCLLHELPKLHTIQIETSGVQGFRIPNAYVRSRSSATTIWVTLSPKPKLHYGIHRDFPRHLIKEFKFVIDRHITLKDIEGCYEHISLRETSIILQPESNKASMTKKAMTFQKALVKSGHIVYVRPQLHRLLNWR